MHPPSGPFAHAFFWPAAALRAGAARRWLVGLGACAAAAGCERPASPGPALPARSSADHRASAAAEPPREPAPSAPPPASAAAPAAPACPSLGGDLEELPLPGHAPAIVYLPEPGRARAPVLVVAHGAGDNPLWQCAWWRHRVGASAFVLCPRGVAAGRLPSGNMGYSYTSSTALEGEIEQAIAALRERHGACVDDGPMLYAGFSQGAIFGVSIVSKRPARFPLAILVEGGNGGAWTAALARRWVAGGGQRVLFGCGSPGCAASARAASAVIERAGAQGRVVEGKGAGHVYWGTTLETAVYGALASFVESDARWGFPPPPERTLDPTKNPPEPRR